VLKALWTPTITGSLQLIGGTTNNTTSSYVSAFGMDIPRIGGTSVTNSTSLRPYPSTFAGLGVRQEIFDFGRIAALSVATESLADIERYRVDAERLDVELSVRESFFAVLASRSISTAADKAYDRAVSHRDMTKAWVDKDLRAPIELTRAEAEVARFNVGRIRAQGGVSLAQTVFGAAVGWEGTALDANGSIDEAPSAPELATAIAAAIKRDPAIKLAMSNVKLQEEKTKAIEAEMRPNLYLTATLSARAGGAVSSNGSTPSLGGWVPQVANWDIGLVLSVPLYDGVVSARSDASKLKEDVAKADLELVKIRAASAIARAYYAYQVARDSIPALERAYDAAVANYAQSDARFKSGLGNAIELSDAEALRVEAEIQLAVGRFELARARALLGRMIAEGS